MDIAKNSADLFGVLGIPGGYDPAKRPPFLKHPQPNGSPAIGALIECFKIVPTIQEEYLATLGCEHDECLESFGCTRHEGLQTESGDSVVWQCDRAVIPEGYLKRQVVHIVKRATGSDYGRCIKEPTDPPASVDDCLTELVVAPDLLEECTPCVPETYLGQDRIPPNYENEVPRPEAIRVVTGLSTTCGVARW